jgi:hypothetical protein
VVPLTFESPGGSGRGDRSDPSDTGEACLRKAQAEAAVVPKIGLEVVLSRWRQW